MRQLNSLREKYFREIDILFLITLAWFIFLLLVNHRYGFHQDELALVDNGRHLAWGYIEYPPLAPFFAYIASKFFGPTLFGYVFLQLFLLVALCC